MISLGLSLRNIVLQIEKKTKFDIVMISPSGPMTAHAAGPHPQTHSERRTNSSSVFPEGIHLDDAVVFLLVCFVCLRSSVFQELVNIFLLQAILLVKVTYP